jgi:hypothetical protein
MLISFISGCTTIKYVYKTNTIYIKPPKELIDDDISLPTMSFNKVEYVLAGPIKRENILSNYIIDLLGTIDEYKIKNKKLSKWYKDVNTTVAK